MPIPRLAGVMFETSRPLMRRPPEVASTNPAMIRSSVVLPEPLGPSTVTHSPFSTTRSTPATAVDTPVALDDRRQLERRGVWPGSPGACGRIRAGGSHRRCCRPCSRADTRALAAEVHRRARRDRRSTSMRIVAIAVIVGSRPVLRDSKIAFGSVTRPGPPRKLTKVASSKLTRKAKMNPAAIAGASRRSVISRPHAAGRRRGSSRRSRAGSGCGRARRRR